MTPALTRREFLKLAGAGASALALSGCGALSSREDLPSPSRTGGSGRVREYAFEAAPNEAGGAAVIGAVQGWMDELEELHGRIAHRFARSEARRRTLSYLKGSRAASNARMAGK